MSSNSGTIYGTFSNNNNNAKLYIKYSYAQDLSAGTTKIECSLYVQKYTSYCTTSKSSTPYSITLNNSAEKGTKSINLGNISVGNSILVATNNTTLNNNSDGSLNISVSAVLDLSGCNPGKGTLSGSIVIPATVTPSTISSITSSVNIGDSLIVRLNKTSNNLQHELTIQCARSSTRYSMTIPSGDSSTSFSMVISDEWVNDYTDCSSFTATAELVVGNFGETSSKSFTVIIPSSYYYNGTTEDLLPTISNISLTAVNSDGSSKFIEDVSKVQISYTATPKKGAKIVTCYAKGSFMNPDYKTFSESGTVNFSLTSYTTIGNGNYQYTIYCIDSRGFTSQYSYRSIDGEEQYTYSIPSISYFYVTRIDSSGYEDSSGTYLKIDTNYSFSDCGGENKIESTNLYYKISTDTSYSLFSTSLIKSGTTKVYSKSFDASNTYNIKIIITDTKGNSTYQISTIQAKKSTPIIESGNFYFIDIMPSSDGESGSVTIGGECKNEKTFSIFLPTTYYSTVETASDRRLKSNIHYLDSFKIDSDKTEEKINNKDLYEFVKNDLYLATYNLNKREQTSIGFIAPDLLYTKDNKESKIGNMIVSSKECYKNQSLLSYDICTYINVLAGALKESINKIEILEKEINDIKNNN